MISVSRKEPPVPRHPGFTPTVEDWLALDVRRLHRRGLLRPGRSGAVQWSSGRGEPTGSVVVRAGADRLTLSYRTRARGGPWQEVEQHVALTSTPCHYGGRRVWFLCPRCGRRCAVLHGGARFYCRRCWGLAYRSQREDAADRARRRARTIRYRLGGGGNLLEPFPAKPKGMWWRTYARLRAEAERNERASLEVMARWLERLRTRPSR
jgi:hypothetical protein